MLCLQLEHTRSVADKSRTSFQLSLFNLLYMIVLSTIVHDDIVLIKWLINQKSPMTDEDNKKPGRSSE